MNSFFLVVTGEPVAQGRPKFSTVGGHPRAVDPAKSREYKQIVSVMARQKMERDGRPLMEGPLRLYVDVYRVPPKSMGKRKGGNAATLHLGIHTKPDLDNYIKLVSDALNGVVFADDSQICQIVASKRYSDKPGIVIEVIDDMAYDPRDSKGDKE